MRRNTGPRVPKHEPVNNVELNEPRIVQVPTGWVVVKYSLSPKMATDHLAFPGFWGGPGSRCWTHTTGGELPAEAKLFPTGADAREAMAGDDIPVHAEDRFDQGELF
jgi:hypothetical protein